MTCECQVILMFITFRRSYSLLIKIKKKKKKKLFFCFSRFAGLHWPWDHKLISNYCLKIITAIDDFI